jgi:hypothetical protein
MLVVASGGLGDGSGDRANVELLTSAFGNVAEQKLATVLWFTVNWARVNAGQAHEVSVIVDGLRICAWF